MEKEIAEVSDRVTTGIPLLDRVLEGGKPTFTPGPWYVADAVECLRPDMAYAICWDVPGDESATQNIAEVHTASDGTARADAELIASAPAMHLELLQLRPLNTELVGALQDCIASFAPSIRKGELNEHGLSEPLQALKRARTVLRRAGELK